MKNTYAQSALMTEFELEVPIVQGPMGGVSGPALVAAVANAGALGILPVWSGSVASAQALITQTQSLTTKSFGINIRADMVQLDHISAAIDAGVSIIHLFWGSPAASMPAINLASVRMIATVADSDGACAALDAGATALIAQGVEAGGHVLSDIPAQELLASVLAVAGDTPVIAAGGCGNGYDGREFMNLGAAGILYGTRFAASRESEGHDDYKAALLEAVKGDTARSLCFDGAWPNAPHRALVNSTFSAWYAAGSPSPGHRPGEGDIVLTTAAGRELPRYYVSTPQAGMTGDIRAAAMYAGTGVDRINDCLDAAQIVKRLSVEMATN
ncbi:MAG: nitronate monooxygenase [Oceanicoccus sp.]